MIIIWVIQEVEESKRRRSFGSVKLFRLLVLFIRRNMDSFWSWYYWANWNKTFQSFVLTTRWCFPGTRIKSKMSVYGVTLTRSWKLIWQRDFVKFRSNHTSTTLLELVNSNRRWPYKEGKKWFISIIMLFNSSLNQSRPAHACFRFHTVSKVNIWPSLCPSDTTLPTCVAHTLNTEERSQRNHADFDFNNKHIMFNSKNHKIWVSKCEVQQCICLAYLYLECQID